MSQAGGAQGWALVPGSCRKRGCKDLGCPRPGLSPPAATVVMFLRGDPCSPSRCPGGGTSFCCQACGHKSLGPGPAVVKQRPVALHAVEVWAGILAGMDPGQRGGGELAGVAVLPQMKCGCKRTGAALRPAVDSTSSPSPTPTFPEAKAAPAHALRKLALLFFGTPQSPGGGKQRRGGALLLPGLLSKGSAGRTGCDVVLVSSVSIAGSQVVGRRLVLEPWNWLEGLTGS